MLYKRRDRRLRGKAQNQDSCFQTRKIGPFSARYPLITRFLPISGIFREREIRKREELFSRPGDSRLFLLVKATLGGRGVGEEAGA